MGMTTQASAAPNLPSPPLNAVAANDAAAQPPLYQWTAAADGRKRSRPTPNLVHHADPNGAVSAGTLVPVEMPQAGVAPQSPAPNTGAPPIDPFAAAAQNSTAAGESATVHSALSQRHSQRRPRRAPFKPRASRPQPPQTPGQIILECRSRRKRGRRYSSAPLVR